jgi:hypothetical protein
VSLRSMIDVTTRLMSDVAYRYQLHTDPDAALTGYDLTPEEAEAFRSLDRWLLESCGLDEWTARWVSALR